MDVGYLERLVQSLRNERDELLSRNNKINAENSDLDHENEKLKREVEELKLSVKKIRGEAYDVNEARDLTMVALGKEREKVAKLLNIIGYISENGYDDEARSRIRAELK